MTKYTLELSKIFKKSFKKLNEKDKEIFYQVLEKLLNEEKLEPKYKDHQLKGKFVNYRECHLRPDLLLVYQFQDTRLVLYCLDIGSHSELF